MAPGERWEVVGGADKGGILVREGQALNSPQTATRLSTGGTVEELELVGDRLHYRILSGTGPEEGWISITLKDKVLAQRLSATPDDMAEGASEPAYLNSKLAPRCQKEWARAVDSWQMVSIENLTQNYNKELPGMRYGMEFPYTPDLLTSGKYGAAWLTKAFHAAGTLPKDNKVVNLFNLKPFVGGGACSKAIFDVQYENFSPELHTKLFMKYPYSFDDRATRSDRINSSVMIQGMEVTEIDSYRLLEASLPFPIPKFYFGDINNTSTNFILITERIPFADKQKPLEELKPFEVEPPYEKFLDDDQFSDAFEYYRVWTEANAKMAGWYKAGKLGDRVRLGKFFFDSTKLLPQSLPEQEFKFKIKMGEEFVTKSAKQLFPQDLVTDANVTEYKRVMNIVNTYRAEMAYAAGVNEDYCAILHGNMNADNTWWWRDENKQLQIGVLDWGGLGKVTIGPKLWWSYYACEYHMLEDHFDDLLQVFVDTYEREGGPALDKALLWRDFMFAALDQGLGILGAIPMIYKTIPKKDWDSVQDRNDKRLINNFLTRMYVQGFVLIYTMLFKFNLSKHLDDFLQTPELPKKKLADI